MKSKEAFLSLVACTLLLTTFCVVALTAHYTDKCVKEPVRHSNSDPGQSESKIILVRSSTGNVQKTAGQAQPKNRLFATSNRHPNDRPGRPKMEQWSADKYEKCTNEKGWFKLVKFNGREYLEDTTGAIDCNNCDENAVENIE